MRPLLLSLILSLSSCCFGSLGGPPSDDQLAQSVTERLLRAHPGARVTVTEPRLLAVSVGELQFQLGLDNLALECAAAPESCDQITDHYVASVLEALASTADESPPAPEQIYAVLHEPEWLRNAAERGAPILTRPFAGDLTIVYVVDYPTTIQTLSAETREALAIGDDDALHALALRNMGTALAAFPIAPLPGAPGVSALTAGDSYESARVLLHDRWAEVARTVQGDLLVSVPCRDRVLIAGSADPAHVAALRAATDHLHATQHHALSRTIFRWTPSAWEAL